MIQSFSRETMLKYGRRKRRTSCEVCVGDRGKNEAWCIRRGGVSLLGLMGSNSEFLMTFEKGGNSFQGLARSLVPRDFVR